MHCRTQFSNTSKFRNFVFFKNCELTDFIFFSEENARLKEQLSAFRQHQNPSTVDNGHKGTTNQQQSDMENCALLGLHLPQPTEYEYLRNILFEFMIGREPVVSVGAFTSVCTL